MPRPRRQLAQPEVALRHRRAHAQRLGEREGLPVAALGALDGRRGPGAGGDITEQMEGPGLLALLMIPTESASASCARAQAGSSAPGDEEPLGEPRQPDDGRGPRPGAGLFTHLGDEGQPFLDAPGQHAGRVPRRRRARSR